MKNRVKVKGTQHAISGLLSIALVSSGLGVVTATPALAETCADPVTVHDHYGDLVGKMQMVGSATKNFKAGEVVTVKGTGYTARPDGYLALKIDKGAHALWKKSDQKNGSDLSTDSGEEESIALHIPNEKITGGAFEVQVVLPAGIKDGKHRFTILGGNDGNDPVGSDTIDFFVDNTGLNDGHCGSLKIEGPVKGVQGSAMDSGHGIKAGDIVVTLGVEELQANATATVTLNDEPLVSVNGKPLVVNEDGVLKARVKIPKGKALAGDYTLKISDGTTTKDIPLVTGVYAGLEGPAIQGSPAKVHVANLPEGATVTGVGTTDTKWWTGSQAATDGVAVVDQVSVPVDAPYGSPVLVTYTVNNVDKIVDAEAAVNVSSAPIAQDSYDVRKLDLGTGLYQSAINDDTGFLYVTRADFKNGSASLYKINAKTLKIEKELPIEAKMEGEKYITAPFGIGVDKERNLVWVTNTLQNSVAVYNQDDLKLVKQWDKDIVSHPRDVVIAKDGKAYISAVSRDKGAVKVVDYKAGTVEEIELTDFPVTMALDLDRENNKLYTISRAKPRVAEINLTNREVRYFNLPADEIRTASGVAFDPVNKNLYIAGNESGNVFVFNVEEGEPLGSIPTGAGALTVRYNPADKRVYVGHRGDGTVVAIDTTTRKVVAKLTASPHVNHITVGADGTVYAVDKATQAGEDHDHLFAITLKGTQQKPDGSAAGGSSDGKEEFPTWATVLLSVLGGLGLLGALAAVLPRVLANFGIRLPF